MFQNVFKPFIRFFKWHIRFFDIRKLWLVTAEKYNVKIITYDTAPYHFMTKIDTLWRWTGIFYSFSSYVLFPVYLFLKYYAPSCPDAIFRLIEGHLFLFVAYLVCNWLQRITMEDNIKDYKEFYEKYKDFL